MLTHKELITRALAGKDVKAEYDRLSEEFELLDEFLKARTSAGITPGGGRQTHWYNAVRCSKAGIRKREALAVIGDIAKICPCPWIPTSVEIDQ